MATRKTQPASRPKPESKGVELPLPAPAAVSRIAEPKTAIAKTLEANVAQPITVKSAPVSPATKARKPVAAKVLSTGAAKPLAVSPARVSTYSVSADFDAAGREVLETCVTCGTIAAKGVEDLSKEVVDFTRASTEAQFALTKALLDAKSLSDALEAQNKFARDSFGALAANWAKMTGMSVELTQELIEPVQTRVNEATRTIWQPLAA